MIASSGLLKGCTSFKCLQFSSLLVNLRTCARDAVRTSSTSATSSSTNALLHIDRLPEYEKINGDLVNEAIPVLVEETERNHAVVEQAISELLKQDDDQLAWDNLVPELEKVGDRIGKAWGAVSHMHSVKDSDHLRNAYLKQQPSLVEMSMKLSQSVPIHNAFKSLKKTSEEKSSLDEAQQRIVDSSIRSAVNSGVDLTDDKKEQFNKIAQELAEAQTKFTNNVLDSTKAFGLMVHNKSDLDGVPSTFLRQSAEAAGKELNKTVDPEVGPWKLTLDMPSYEPVMKHCKNSAIRESLYMGFIQRASHGEHDNSQLIDRIRELRAIKASLLGHKDFAHLSLSGKMAQTPDKVWQMIHSMRDLSRSVAETELNEVRAHAQENNHEGEMRHWDVTYWSERRKEQMFNMNEELMRQYFPLDVVLDGMFQLVQNLFQIKITEHAHGTFSTWNEHVRFFDITDIQNGGHIASFYLDPFSRPEEKNGGAWMNTAVDKSDVFNRSPVAYLICNQSPPIGEIPSLMSFREVETLFHEFGHGLQHMLTEVQYTSAAGINNIEWDAVELPSQFMENWLYDWTTMQTISRHYQTNHTLPEEMFQQVVASRKYMAGSGMLRQLYFSALDIQFYSSSLPWREIMQNVASEYTVLPPLEQDSFPCSFMHIFGGGYAAGYYSYKWAEVMAADAFAAFEEAGLDNREAMQSIGMQFRKTVLAMGGGKDPNEVFKTFRGREPNTNALMKMYGLV